MLTLGIDDAGRGPLIGNMILAGVLLDKELELEFKKQGVRDSKQLTSIKREILAEIIKKKSLAFEFLASTPEEIDSSINSKVNLNTLEAIKAAEIINEIRKRTPEIKIKVIVDCPSVNISAWTKTLKSYVSNLDNLEFVVEHKADINHISVSAASILAKSERENNIHELKKKLGVDFGSGYPSDPITCKFLKDYSKNHESSGIFRKTWQTWKDNCARKNQEKLDSFKT